MTGKGHKQPLKLYQRTAALGCKAALQNTHFGASVAKAGVQMIGLVQEFIHSRRFFDLPAQCLHTKKRLTVEALSR